MTEDGFLTDVTVKGATFQAGLNKIVMAHPKILSAVRGVGFMCGLHCTIPNVQFVTALRAGGMLAVEAGENVVRLLPPLTISYDQIDEAHRIIEQAAITLESCL